LGAEGVTAFGGGGGGGGGGVGGFSQGVNFKASKDFSLTIFE
jgi:hypothetical protein